MRVSPPTTRSYPVHKNSAVRRVRRQSEAQQRQLHYEALTLTEKIARIESRRGRSLREHTRLLKEL